ncbi:hypothetical protein BH24DEI2_BH24DEI2_08610 [soil metagenome]
MLHSLVGVEQLRTEHLRTYHLRTEHLRTEHLSFTLRGRDLLRDISLTLRSGERVGLLGAKGVGKTTLLRLLAGELASSEGRVLRSPGVRLAYVAQSGKAPAGSVYEVASAALEHVHALERELRLEEKRLAASGDLERYGQLTALFEAAGGYEAEAALDKMLLEFGFTQDQFGRSVASLSGGERARLGLATALAARPDVLLLDEPTNHLDLLGRRTLQKRFGAYEGALLLASHDRALLDAVCTHIAHLKDGQLTLHRGNYSVFRTQQGVARRSAVKQAKERAKETARLGESAQRLRAWGTPTAQRQRKSLERRTLARHSPAFTPVAEAAAHLSLRPAAARGTLLSAKHLSKRLGERVLVDDVALRVEAGDKVALLGPNGSGKTTLLKLLAGATESDDPRAELVWAAATRTELFDQVTRGVTDDATPFEQLERYVSRARASQLLALVNLPPAAWDKPPATLSGGERARLGLALLVAGEANLLLLDEPSTDLDIPALETLEDTLASTDAAVILVTHDERLVEAVATRVWSLVGGELVEYRGGVAGYLKGVRRLEPEPEQVPQNSDKKEPVEDVLESLEDEKMMLETRLLDPLRLGERERERLEARLKTLLHDLSERYDAALSDPLPRYRAASHGVVVTTNGFENGRADFATGASFTLRLLFPSGAAVGHVTVLESEGACSLSWARVAALAALSRIAVEHLDVKTLQVQSADELSGAGFKPAGGNWWLLNRARYEKRLGYAG